MYSVAEGCVCKYLFECGKPRLQMRPRGGGISSLSEVARSGSPSAKALMEHVSLTMARFRGSTKSAVSRPRGVRKVLGRSGAHRPGMVMPSQRKVIWPATWILCSTGGSRLSIDRTLDLLLAQAVCSRDAPAVGPPQIRSAKRERSAGELGKWGEMVAPRLRGSARLPFVYAIPCFGLGPACDARMGMVGWVRTHPGGVPMPIVRFPLAISISSSPARLQAAGCCRALRRVTWTQGTGCVRGPPPSVAKAGHDKEAW